MAIEPENERSSAKLKVRMSELEANVKELERCTKALIKGMKELEDTQDEAYMPEGEYYGIKFED